MLKCVISIQLVLPHANNYMHAVIVMQQTILWQVWRATWRYST